jgi:hypothetical protein
MNPTSAAKTQSLKASSPDTPVIMAKTMENGNPSYLLELAVSKDLDIDKLSRLMDLQRTWHSEQARKSFFQSMNDFQASVPEIIKTKKVQFETRNGNTAYFYATLADIIRGIKETCRVCGLSYRWEFNDTEKEIKVTCIITHIDGHSEITIMTAPADDSGSKNKIQSRASTIEYLKRYTLIGALGLSTADDTDAQSAGPEKGNIKPVEKPITTKSVDELHTEYMELFEELVKLDESYRTKADPDNWKTRTAKTYVAAIAHTKSLINEKSKPK